VKNKHDKEHTWIEEIEIAGSELIGRIKEVIAEGNVRRLIVKKPNGDLLLEVPLTAGVAVGSVFTIAAPVIAALGAMAGLLARVKLEIVRVDESKKTGKREGSKRNS
jgi:hypothetical protein